MSVKGGAPRVYALPGLAEVSDALRGRLPPADAVVGVDAAQGLLYVRTAKQELLAFDLESGRSDTVATGVTAAVMGPDQTVYAVDAKHHVTDYSRRSRVAWPQALGAAPRALFGAGDERLIAVLGANPPRLVTATSDGAPLSRPVPDAVDVSAARWGDVIALAADSGVFLTDPFDRRSPAFVPLPDHPDAIAFSPSGHRIYVARKSALGLAVIDRFTHQEIDGIGLPAPASAIRLDPWGRWLLARSDAGDSAWVVDLPTKALVGSVATEWAADLPAISPDGTLLVRQGADVVAYRADSLTVVGRVAGGAADRWAATAWTPRGRALGTPLAAADTGITGDQFYVQVSISQNPSWSQEMAQQLSRAGLSARVLPPASGDDGYRVVLGPYGTREQAEDIGKKLGRPFWIYQPGQ